MKISEISDMDSRDLIRLGTWIKNFTESSAGLLYEKFKADFDPHKNFKEFFRADSGSLILENEWKLEHFLENE